LFGPLHRNLLAGVTELIASDHWRVAGMLSLQPFGSWESYRCQAAGGKLRSRARPYIFTDTEYEPRIDNRFAAIKQGFDRIRGRQPRH
jgi:hypothetical protein